MFVPSLSARLRQLEHRLRSREPLGPSNDIPFAIFVYDPHDELALRREAEMLTTRLKNAGRPATLVDLGALLWECMDAHPAGPDALREAEEFGEELEVVLREGHTVLVGTDPREPGPLERRLIERLEALDPERDVAFLLRAGELFPLYRTSALLERLMGQLRQPVPTILFYPGTLSGVAELSFMGVCEPSPNYRPTILA